MAIQVANPDDGLEVDDDLFKEADTQYNFRELLDQVINSADKDIIISVEASDVDALKQGLIRRKAKDNVKTKGAGLLPDTDVLAFLVYPRKDDKGNEIIGEMDVRVQLRPRRGVKILDIRVPDDL